MRVRVWWVKVRVRVRMMVTITREIGFARDVGDVTAVVINGDDISVLVSLQ